jgi:hypothetical protein
VDSSEVTKDRGGSDCEKSKNANEKRKRNSMDNQWISEARNEIKSGQNRECGKTKKGEKKKEGDERTGRRKKEKEKTGRHEEGKGHEGKEERDREERGRDSKKSRKKERGER